MGQRFQIIIKDGKDYYVYHNQWFYGGTAISFTDQFLKALTKMNFKKALVEAGKKNDFREEPVKFYRYFSSNNSEMEGNDNIEIAKSKDWDAFLKTLDNNDGNPRFVKKENRENILWPNIIEGDFNRLLKQARRSNIPFIAIFIDEADLFCKNKGLHKQNKEPFYFFKEH